MRTLHAACVRMARADYGGDGRPHTRAGVALVFWDRFGVRPRPTAERLPFEAGWDADGAVCVVRPRIAALAPLRDLRRRYPRLRRHRTCDDPSAFAAGALIANRIVTPAAERR